MTRSAVFAAPRPASRSSRRRRARFLEAPRAPRERGGEVDPRRRQRGPSRRTRSGRRASISAVSSSPECHSRSGCGLRERARTRGFTIGDGPRPGVNPGEEQLQAPPSVRGPRPSRGGARGRPGSSGARSGGSRVARALRTTSTITRTSVARDSDTVPGHARPAGSPRREGPAPRSPEIPRASDAVRCAARAPPRPANRRAAEGAAVLLDGAERQDDDRALVPRERWASGHVHSARRITARSQLTKPSFPRDNGMLRVAEPFERGTHRRLALTRSSVGFGVAQVYQHA